MGLQLACNLGAVLLRALANHTTAAGKRPQAYTQHLRFHGVTCALMLFTVFMRRYPVTPSPDLGRRLYRADRKMLFCILLSCHRVHVKLHFFFQTLHSS